MLDPERATNAEAALERLLSDFAARRPPIRVVPKRDHAHQRFVGALLRIVTLGGQSTYLSRYVTTLGRTIYVPDAFDTWRVTERLAILRHEAVHVAQFERLGVLGMTLVYGLFPLPIGLSYGRARLEWEAYAETLRAIAELEGIEAARAPALHATIVRRFTGPDYLWMWPFPRTVEKWIEEELARIERA